MTASAGSPPAAPLPAQLLDQRDQLLEQMSAISDVSVSIDVAGRAAVRLGGATGPTLVSGSDAGAVTYVRNDAGSVSFAVHRDGEISTACPVGRRACRHRRWCPAHRRRARAAQRHRDQLRRRRQRSTGAGPRP